ncbi:WcaA Glycosyltransferases involved in cell wall biogenesis [Candidatus Nanopelagicaceae bacterium]
MVKEIATEKNELLIAVVIPAFKVKAQILEVIASIGPEVKKIIVVDDACPENSGEFVKANCEDHRVEVIFHKINLGVGGAVKTGYKRSLEINAEIVVKIDGDGQMDTSRIAALVTPISSGQADYAKGNRFFDVETVRAMPKVRILGNLGLSFLTKLSTGYWQIFDPNNGFTAISRNRLQSIPLEKIDDGYFFESDMLFRLNLINAVVRDVPMPAIYENEKSNLKVRRVLIEFPFKHSRNFTKRILYSYYLRDFNLASIELPLGITLGLFGTILGAYSWFQGISNGRPTQPGTLILTAMSMLAGLQLVLAFLSYDTKGNGSH